MSPIEPQVVEQILDQHGKKFEKQDARISKLEETTTKILITQAEMSVKLSNIEISNNEIKKILRDNADEQNQLINKIIDIYSENNKEDKKIINNNQNKLWNLLLKHWQYLVLL